MSINTYQPTSWFGNILTLKCLTCIHLRGEFLYFYIYFKFSSRKRTVTKWHMCDCYYSYSGQIKKREINSTC